MHLSREALELCAKKYDRGRLKGFGFKEEMSFESGKIISKTIFRLTMIMRDINRSRWK